MTFFRALSAAVFSLSVFASGCSGADGDDADLGALDIDDPLYGAMGGPGGSGATDGFMPASFHANKYKLFASAVKKIGVLAGAPLVWHFASSNEGISALLFDPPGRSLLKTAVGCALTGPVYDGSTPYNGEHLLAATTDWKTQPLTLPQTEDLFACVLARVNAFDVDVSLNLSGPRVYDDPTFDPAPFAWGEGLWVADITLSGNEPIFNFHVWPLEDYLADNCGSAQKLKYRVCGSLSDSECRLTVRSDKATACSESTDGWRCAVGGALMPAIQTRLKVEDAHALYWPGGPPSCL